jgi:predicted component of type VI protein secretion system
MQRGFTAAAAVVLCLTMAGCKSGDKGIKLGTEHKVGDAATYSLTAADQSGKGKAVKIPLVNSTDKGFVVIHADGGGNPGEVIGHSELLSPGETKNVRVKLDKKLTASGKVWPMLYSDTNGNGTFDASGGDQPAKVNNAVVTIAIDVTLR